MLSCTYLLDQIDLSSRANRKKAVALSIDLLERVHAAEDANIERFPVNLQNSDAFANAECSLDVVTDAIITLGDAY